MANPLPLNLSDQELAQAWFSAENVSSVAARAGGSVRTIQKVWTTLRERGMIPPERRDLYHKGVGINRSDKKTVLTVESILDSFDGRPRINEDRLLTALVREHRDPRYDIDPESRRETRVGNRLR